MCNYPLAKNDIHIIALMLEIKMLTVGERNGPLTERDEKYWVTSWENLFMPYANNKGADRMGIRAVWSAPLLFAA